MRDRTAAGASRRQAIVFLGTYILHNRRILTASELEELNAHGPYSMAVWSAGGVSVGNEEGLKGRSAYFIRLIRQAILETFSPEELPGLSILDVGCNDGWVLHQLSDLPFARLVGVEPREKNIRKGQVVRRILNLENRVEYRCGDVESLDGEQFDIVICAGVLYHVESIPHAVRQLRKCCRRLLFIESRCMSSRFITRSLRDHIEMRDLVYQFAQPICGLTAQKFESAYHDGSARETTVVNIPTTESLLMYLEISGFCDLKVVADTDTYRASVWRNRRPLDGVCISASVNANTPNEGFDEEAWIRQYEKGLREALLPRALVHALYRYFVEGTFTISWANKWMLVLLYIKGPSWMSRLLMKVLPLCVEGRYALEIAKNFRYSARDKIALEYGKLLMSEGRTEDALRVLKEISSRLNADWRSVYRSFYLISQMCGSLGRTSEATRYADLCLTCNPKYPISM